jgi:PTH1 family peptidyl-tRNA hydrolase
MKLIVGLGNVGDKYCFTRHNAGFMVVDKLAIEKNVTFKLENKFKCFICKYKHGLEDIMLIKPTTFMNLSGDAVQLVMNYYKIDVSNVIIVYDDLSLELGKIRFRPNGSDGGHNGIKSVIKCVGTQNIARLKVGIGPQPPIPSETFVLQNFTTNQLETLKPVLKRSIEGLEYYFNNDMQSTQNKYN